VKYPLGILKDVPTKVGDFYVHVDFVILGMGEDAYTQIILGSPFLAIVGCRIDVKEGRLTFDVGERHAEFGLFKGYEFSPSSLDCFGCNMLVSNNTAELVDASLNDSQVFDFISFEGQGLDSDKGDFVEHLPPNIIKDDPMFLMRFICRFA